MKNGKLNKLSLADVKIAVKVLKTVILQSQCRAVRKTNQELLSLYYGIGHYISDNSRTGFWGTGAIEAISSQLKRELPGLLGFSAANLKTMRIFYEEWNPVLNRQPAADDLTADEFTSLWFSLHNEF